jgi:hypothetical protein
VSETKSLNFNVFLAPRAPRGLLHFVSGASAPADLRGLSRFLVPAGISLPELSTPMLDELVGMSHLPWPIFTDTGAFSEVEMVDGRPVVVAPIDEATWHRRLAMSLRIAEAFGPRAYVVAPDRVGDQEETLARLRSHRDEVLELREAGGRVVLPHQRGGMTTAAFGRAAAEVLGFDDFIPAIPGNKDAMPPAELEDFLRAARPTALHLLGVGSRSPRLPPLLDLCRRLIPGARWSGRSPTRRRSSWSTAPTRRARTRWRGRSGSRPSSGASRAV